jgi:predicted dehydrogenase
MSSVAKVLRFVGIYGPGRTLFKAAGRLRIGFSMPTLRRTSGGIGVIGCGQFAFATIGYFLRKQGARIDACYDIDATAQTSFARALRVKTQPCSSDALLALPGLSMVYIASNHASHTPYALQSLARDIDTYIEKPIAVSEAQLVALLRAQRRSKARLFAGYNRPFSGAIRMLRRWMPIDPSRGITLQCYVSGHVIAPDHWYRRPEEGTRVCGNIGHWLDLLVHLLAWRGMPDQLELSLAVADPAEPDDNLSIGITSDMGDLFSVMLSSRTEPFEGINETINIQHHETIAKIDDFRRLTIWQGERLLRSRFWPKDVGHGGAIAQPLAGAVQRDWNEVVRSTQLMLHIADMVRHGKRRSMFSLRDNAARLAREIENE